MKNEHFLQNNFMKILDVKKASYELNNQMKKWLERVAQDFQKKHSEILAKPEQAKSYESEDASEISFYILIPFNSKKITSHIELKITYDDIYYFEDHFGYYPVIKLGISKKNENAVNEFSDFFESTLSKELSEKMNGLFFEKRSNELLLSLEDDKDDKFKIAKDLSELENDLIALAEESIRLIDLYKN